MKLCRSGCHLVQPATSVPSSGGWSIAHFLVLRTRAGDVSFVTRCSFAFRTRLGDISWNSRSRSDKSKRDMDARGHDSIRVIVDRLCIHSCLVSRIYDEILALAYACFRFKHRGIVVIV
jgi:hypothetical protein